MKKHISKIVGLLLGMAMAIGVGVGIGNNNNVTRLDAADSIAGYDLVYENTCPKSTTNSAYATTYTVDVGGTEWKAPGNQFDNGDWRIGGAKGTDVSRVLYTTEAISGTINRIRIKWGTCSVDSFSATVTVHNNAADAANGANAVSTFSGSNAYAVSSSKDLDNNTGWAGKFYRISCTYSHTNSKNKYQSLQSIAFYSKSASESLVFSTDEISGEEGVPFSFTWTDSNLSSAISWTPANASTDVIDYEVNTGTKTVSGTLQNAGEVTLTGTSGGASDSVHFVVSAHETNRKYTIESTSSVEESGDAMTGTSSSFTNTYTNNKEQITSPNTMTLTITGMENRVIINKLVFSMHSNGSAGAGYVTIAVDGGEPTYIEGTSLGTEFINFGDETTSYGTSYREITWEDDVDFTAETSIVIVIACTTNSLYCEWFDIFFTEQEIADTVTALSVTPNSWSGYTTDAIDVSDYVVSVTKNGSSGTSADYDFQGIGSGAGDEFIARVADFSNGYPSVSDTRLQWKAKYPTTAGGSTYLYAYVSLTVSLDNVTSIQISGNLSNTSLLTTRPWDPAGLVVNATHASTNVINVTNNSTFKFYSNSSMTNEIETPADLGPCANQKVYVKATYLGVSNATGFEQTVTVDTALRATFIAGTDYGDVQESISKDGVTICTAVEEGTFIRDDNYRVYKNKQVTISSSGSNIVKIEFVCTSAKYNTLVGEGYTADGANGVWTGNATEVVLTASSAENEQTRCTKIIVTFDTTHYEIENTLTSVSALKFNYEQIDATFTYTGVNIRFGGFISKTLWDQLDNESNIQGYGVMVAANSDLDGQTIKQRYYAAKTSENTVEQAINSIHDTYSVGKKVVTNKAHPAEATSEQKTFMGVDSGDYYIWTVQKPIGEAFTSKFNAVAFILIDGDIVFLQEVSLSAKEIATRDVVAHPEDPALPALTYMKDH